MKNDNIKIVDKEIPLSDSECQDLNIGQSVNSWTLKLETTPGSPDDLYLRKLQAEMRKKAKL